MSRIAALSRTIPSRSLSVRGLPPSIRPRATVLRAPAVRLYASQGPEASNNPKSPPKPSRTLWYFAGVGFSAAIVYRLGKDAFGQGDIKLDGAPAVNFVDTDGKPWYPGNAHEQDDPRNPMRIRMANWVMSLQDHIVVTLEALEAIQPPLATEASPSTTGPPKFKRDHWIRSQGGEGSSCVLSGGRIFEKAGVNVSIVHGKLPPAAQKAMRADHSSLPKSEEALPFYATGLSIVLHPRNPHVPTVHLNYRYFEVDDASNPDQPVAWWFGGGSDLTPSYLVEQDVRHFHQTLKDACDLHSPNYYPAWKPECDKYFTIPHRNESRGVGGIFFDDLTATSALHTVNGKGKTQEEIFDTVKTMSGAFLPSYLPIVLRNKDKGWTDEERRWQLLRRGRYVEFNLVYDRGTKFGLATPGARIESILMSLPEIARWEYQSEMGADGTEEGKLLEILRNPKEWASSQRVV